MPFQADLSPWLGFSIDDAWLDENVRWRDFGNGSELGKLHREDKTGLVLYRISADAGDDAFTAHAHPGGEAYVVLRGEVYDDDGTYPVGSIVWMTPGSRHLPKTRGDTLILVLWPAGVEA